MESGEVKIILRPRGLTHQLRRWLGRRPAVAANPPTDTNVDLTLVTQVASEHVRQFIEAIQNYQLVSQDVVQVVSHYRMPDHGGLREQIPVWLSERIRFGVVAADGCDFRYCDIEAVEMRWDDDGSELSLFLGESIRGGARAFIAAYLGEGVDAQAMRGLPISTLGAGGQDR